jgi:hypothetical protein
MRKFLLGTGMALMLAGCAGPGYGGGGGVAYDGFYDNAYGPIYDGYWGDGDAFFYRSHRHGHYVRDTGSHFRHDAVNGFQPMHVNGPAFRDHGAGHGRNHH